MAENNARMYHLEGYVRYSTSSMPDISEAPSLCCVCKIADSASNTFSPDQRVIVKRSDICTDSAEVLYTHTHCNL